MNSNDKELIVKLILVVFFIWVLSPITPKTSPGVVFHDRTAIIKPGDTVVFYYSDRLFYVRANGNMVEIQTITSDDVTTLCDPECEKDIYFITINSIHAKKVENGVEVTFPRYVNLKLP